MTEGARVSPEWLARFLANPALSEKDADRDGVRGYLKARMPTFYFSPIEIQKLVRFFQALSTQPMPYIPPKLDPLTTQETAMARALFTSKGAPCLKCHAIGVAAHDRFASAPNFLLAPDRLKPDWVTHWILDPAMIDPGTHPYYRRITSALVSLAVHAPGGPPRSSQEFLARLDEKWLKYAYAGKVHWYAQRKIKKLSEHIYDTSLTYDGFFDGVAGGLDGAFAYEDADAVYVGLDGDALKEQAVSMARYLLEDAAHYAKHRKAPGVRTLCIIDEFGALGISNVAGLYEHMREAGLSMWASAQSYQGLGPERGNVLAASSIKILHLRSRPRRHRTVTTDSQHSDPVAANLLDRDCTAEAPNTKWVTDIPGVWTAEGWLYVAVVLDLFSRMVVGWAMAPHRDTELVEQALQMALAHRHPSVGLLHHSDRGSQYTSAC